MTRLTGSPIHLVRVVDMSHLVRYSPYGLAVEHAAYEQAFDAEESASRVSATSVSPSMSRTAAINASLASGGLLLHLPGTL
jgi:hypothetical protein